MLFRSLQLQTQHLITLEDAVVVERKQDGKIKLLQARSTAGAGALGGALWGGLIGLIFFMPFLGAAIGAGTGALAGKSVDTIKPPAAFGLAAVLAGINPKNLLIAVGAAAAIAQTGISGGQQAVAYAIFALIGTLGVGIPVGIYFALGDRSTSILGSLKDWMARNNAVIMAVLCLVIGAKLIGDAIGALVG